jgi:hypothetical protein
MSFGNRNLYKVTEISSTHWFESAEMDYKDTPRFVLYNLADYFGDATEWGETVKFFISLWYG